MNDRPATIAVVRGAPNADVQTLLRMLAERWSGSLRLAGVVGEEHGLPDRECGAGYLRSLATAERFPMFHAQPAPAGCHLDGHGVLTAADAVQRDIARGCDLVVLNKFGQLEGSGKGLSAAFTAAIAARIPLLTSVSGERDAKWRTFAGVPYVVLPVDADAVDAWKQRVLGNRAGVTP